MEALNVAELITQLYQWDGNLPVYVGEAKVTSVILSPVAERVEVNTDPPVVRDDDGSD
jgi:hypothetical protein